MSVSDRPRLVSRLASAAAAAAGSSETTGRIVGSMAGVIMIHSDGTISVTDRRQNTDTRCTPTHKRTVFVHCFREHYSHQSRLYTLSAVYSIVDKCLLYCFNDMWQPNTNERHIFNERSNEYRMCSYMHHLIKEKFLQAYVSLFVTDKATVFGGSGPNLACGMVTRVFCRGTARCSSIVGAS